jgi:HSP20 family protein
MEAKMNMRSLIPWSRETATPVNREFDEPNSFLALHRQVNRLFDDFFRDFDTPLSRGWSSSWPSVEVAESEKDVKVIAELPGLDEKDIDITLRDGVLTLKGEKKQESSGASYSERWHGQFARSIQLGPEVDHDKANASFNRGVLTITLQKRADAQSQVKRIAINKT